MFNQKSDFDQNGCLVQIQEREIQAFYNLNIWTLVGPYVQTVAVCHDAVGVSGGERYM